MTEQDLLNQELEKRRMTEAWIKNLIMQVFTLYNAFASSFSLPHINWGNDKITLLANFILLILSSAVIFWSNNNITSAAKEGQLVTNTLKIDPNAEVIATLNTEEIENN